MSDESSEQDHQPMEPDRSRSISSGAMDAAPPLPSQGATTRGVEPRGGGSPTDEGVAPEQVSLGQRLRQPRTIASILVPFVIFAIFFLLNREQLAKVPTLIARASPPLVLAAFVIFYLGFPLRGYRWSLLLRGTGFRLGVKDSTEIIFLSWFVNCVVPAKLGDVYRAWLLKINSTASFSRTLGTVFIERILDVFAIATLGLAAGYWSFRDGLPPAIEVVFAIALVVMAALALGLFTLRNFGRRILVALPFPAGIVELYDRFEEGVFDSIQRRSLPTLIVVTGLIWATEGLRLFLVVKALGFPEVSLGLSGALFVALIGSLLTAVPLSPAGLGIVEAGIVGVLTIAYGVPLPEATAIALLDRAISVFSIIVFGAIGYVVSPMPRGEAHIHEPPAVPEPA